MAKYVFYTTITEYGTIEVEANSRKEADDLAWEMKGNYCPHEKIIEDIVLKK